MYYALIQFSSFNYDFKEIVVGNVINSLSCEGFHYESRLGIFSPVHFINLLFIQKSNPESTLNHL